MKTVESKGKDGKNRLGFVTLINTEVLANDGGPQYKQVREIPGYMQATQLIDMGIGWRLYDAKQEQLHLKTFDPEAAKFLKEQKEQRERLEDERLQKRIVLVVQNGGMPDLATLKAMSEQDFQAALSELIDGGEDKPVKGKPGPKPKEQVA